MSRTPGLYEEDFFLWTRQQAAHLRQGLMTCLDRMNLAEEIESMGKRDRRTISHHLTTILLNRLEEPHLPDAQVNAWRCAIHAARQELDWILTDSPSLRDQLTDLIDTAYPGARRMAAAETGLPLAIFPEQCPFAVEQVIDHD